MAFGLSFHRILDTNIRHVYSGHPLPLRFRHSDEYPNMDQLRRQEEGKRMKQSMLTTSEFVQEHRCYLAKAPAFKILPNEKVDKIVERVRAPSLAARKAFDKEEEEDDDDDSDEDDRRTRRTRNLYSLETKVDEKLRFSGRKMVSFKELEQSVERLNKPTVMSQMRDRSAERRDITGNYHE